MDSKFKSLQAHIDRLTQMPTSLTKSLERLNSVQEQHLKKMKSLPDIKLNIPKYDVAQIQNRHSQLIAAMDDHHQAIRDENIRRENELRDRHNEIVTMQSNIVDAINQTVNYQKKLSIGSNRVQYAILVIAILSLITAVFGVVLGLM